MATENEIVYEIKAKVDDIEKKLSGIEKSAESSGNKISGSFNKIGAAAIAAAGAITSYFIAQGIKESIKEAIAGEEAVNKMNSALAQAGRFSIEASQDLQNYASEMQKVTKLADDQTMQYLALASAYTKNNQQSKQLVSAAVDMSEAMGISVDAAVRNLGGSLSGVTGQLSRMLPQVRGMTEEQLKAGGAIDLVAKRFGGAASNAVEAFSGKLIQAKNAWSDYNEAFGNIIVKSPSLIKAIDFVKRTIEGMTQSISGVKDDPFKQILLTTIDIAKFFTFALGPILEFIIDTFVTLGQTIGRVAAILVTAIEGNFRGAWDQTKLLFTKTGDDIKDIFTYQGTESATAWLDSFGKEIASTSGQLNEMITPKNQENVDLGGGAAAEARKELDLLTYAYEAFSNFYAGKMDDLKKLTEEWKLHSQKAFQSVKKAMFSSVVSGFTNAFSSIGAALVNGENAFTAFGKAIVGMFGDLAIQLGQYYLLLGLATLWTNPAAGAGMIAGGIALIALGGALKALSGGQGQQTASSGSTNSGITSGVGDTLTQLQDTEERQRQTNVTVNIEGNVLGDKRTLGREIADALNEAFGTDGVVIARGAIV